jgi:hypothetical protein
MQQNLSAYLLKFGKKWLILFSVQHRVLSRIQSDVALVDILANSTIEFNVRACMEVCVQHVFLIFESSVEKKHANRMTHAAVI